MSEGRARILGSVRRALRRGPDVAAEWAAVRARLAGHPRGPVPARATLPPAAQRDLFVTMAEAANASVARVAGMGEVPAAVADYLRAHNLPARARVAPELDGLAWSDGALEVGFGPAEDADPVGVTRALAGVAETGTLVLASGAATPVTLNYLPETAVVVLGAAEVVGSYEDAIDVVRGRFGADLPRTLNMVTGPSRTADIEQTIQLGAHGPRRLHVVLVGEADG